MIALTQYKGVSNADKTSYNGNIVVGITATLWWVRIHHKCRNILTI